MADVTPSSWHPDVWLLSDRDTGSQLLGSPDDFLVFNLPEHIAGGYEWDIDSAVESALEIRRDKRTDVSGESVGGTVTRRVVFQGNRPARTKLRLEERRPWESEGSSINSLEFNLALLGKEPVGMLRAERLMAA